MGASDLMETCRSRRDLRSAGAGNGEKSRPKSSPPCAYEFVRRTHSFRWLLCAASVPAHFGLGLGGSLAEYCRKLGPITVAPFADGAVAIRRRYARDFAPVPSRHPASATRSDAWVR